jgi:2,4-dienoyl-CoA reductase-like NADH-dependent reductase (Old Yellow Enzyme family)
MSALFTPFRVGSLALRNRIVIAPMCQYSASEGRATDWHVIHLGNLALSGAGLLMIEATAVTPEGRISPDDLGLWSDETEESLGRVVEIVRRYSDMPIAIQLAHAGRKASTQAPWKGGRQIRPDEDRGWQTVAPSAIPFADGENPPVALDRDGLAAVRDAFVDAARRSARLGLDAIQLHAAHGYLLHQFLSPIANKRDDEYGGSLENRVRFPLEVFEAARRVFPTEKPVSMRVSGTDWVEGAGISIRLSPLRKHSRHGAAARFMSRAAAPRSRSRFRSVRVIRCRSPARSRPRRTCRRSRLVSSPATIKRKQSSGPATPT